MKNKDRTKVISKKKSLARITYFTKFPFSFHPNRRKKVSENSMMIPVFTFPFNISL